MSKMSEISAQNEQEYQELVLECGNLFERIKKNRAEKLQFVNVDNANLDHVKETFFQGNHIGGGIVSKIEISAKTLIVEFS